MNNTEEINLENPYPNTFPKENQTENQSDKNTVINNKIDLISNKPLNSDLEQLHQIERERQEVLKRIQKNQRIMDLLRNKDLKMNLKEIEEFNSKKEKEEKLKEEALLAQKEKDKQILLEREKQKVRNDIKNAELEINLDKAGDNLSLIIAIQRKWRKYIYNKNKEKIRDSFVKKIRENFLGPITYERAAELRKIIIERIKCMKFPNENDFQFLVNDYFNKYRDFCIDFPNSLYTRETNFLLMFQCIEIVNYFDDLEKNMKKGENMASYAVNFNRFMLDKNKEILCRMKVDDMEKKFLNKNTWYQYTVIDDFEENNILNEIDARYEFESRDEILRKK